MTRKQKIKAFFLLGKTVRVKKVEQPDVVGKLFSVDNVGFCSISGNGGHYYIDEIKKYST